MSLFVFFVMTDTKVLNKKNDMTEKGVDDMMTNDRDP